MKNIVVSLLSLFSFIAFAQETLDVSEEFIPIVVEGKEAYMSTKTGEYTYRKHSETDETQLKTTASGVVYTDISSHTIKKGETLFVVAKKNGVTIADLKKYNKVTNSNLKIGSKLKIVKKLLVKSSSPVISYAGEERIIARLRPGESPGALAPPPPMEEIKKKLIKSDKNRESSIKPTYKVDNNIKNPVLGLGNESEAEVTNIKEVTKESKKERLKRLKAEMETLEAEIKETTSIEELADTNQTYEEIATENEVLESKNHNVHDGHDHKVHATKEIKQGGKEISKETEFETPIISEDTKQTTLKALKELSKENSDKKETESNNSNEEESLAEKASRVVSQVKSNKKGVKVSTSVKENNEEVAKKENEVKSTKETKSFYTVEKDNSLWSIARQHNMTVDALKKLNNLKNNTIEVGQKLKVVPKSK